MNDRLRPIALASLVAVLGASRVAFGAPVTEREAVRAALAHNPTLAAAIGELRRAELHEEAQAHSNPFTLALDAGATRSRTPSLGAGDVNVSQDSQLSAGAELRRHLPLGTDVAFRVEGTSDTSQAYLAGASAPFDTGPAYGITAKVAVIQPLLRGAGPDVYYAERDASQQAAVQASATRDQTASQLLYDVLNAYWELDYATRTVSIDQRSLELAAAQRDDTAARVKTGSAAAADLLTFETRVATLEEELLGAQAEEQRRRAELVRVIGDGSLEITGADTSVEPYDPPEVTPDLTRRILDGSYELAQLRAAVALSEVQARTADDPLRARLDLSAWVQAQGLGDRSVRDAGRQLGAMDALSAHVGLTYEAALDGTQRRNERERASLAVVVARRKLEAAEQRIRADVDKAMLGLRSARQRVVLADKTRGIAVRQLEAQTLRYKTGSATSLDVREAEDQVRTVELRAARARADMAIAGLSLDQMSGRLLSRWATSGS